jgi:hypothetical protein
MSVSSALATSRRNYLSQTELAQMANITITDTAEADDVINQAEEMIDGYIGFEDKFIPMQISETVERASTLSFTLDAIHQNCYDRDHFKGCEVEIIGGTGEGQRRKITASTREGVCTIDSAWTTLPDSTSFYNIYQLGKFPRYQDVKFSNEDPIVIYKSIPEAVKRAIAAQVEYIIEMGDSYFNGDKANIKSESIGDYSYTKDKVGTASLIAPKAKQLLHGLVNRVGQLCL